MPSPTGSGGPLSDSISDTGSTSPAPTGPGRGGGIFSSGGGDGGRSGEGGMRIRSQFFSKLGGCDSNKLEEILQLGQNRDIDKTQLRQFVFKYQVADSRRFEVWCLLLDVTSGFPELRDSIQRHHDEEADLLLRSLHTMRLSEDREGSPKPSDMVRMLLLSRGCLGDRVDFRNDDVAPIVNIVHHMRVVAGFDRWRDAFALSRAAHAFFIAHFPDHTIESIKNELSAKKDDRDLSHIQWNDAALRLAIRSGCSSFIKNPRALQKLWDKFFSGAESPPFLMTQVLILYASVCIKCEVHDDLIRKLSSGVLTSQDESNIVCEASSSVLRKPRIKQPEKAPLHESIPMPILMDENGGERERPLRHNLTAGSQESDSSDKTSSSGGSGPSTSENSTKNTGKSSTPTTVSTATLVPIQKKTSSSSSSGQESRLSFSTVRQK